MTNKKYTAKLKHVRNLVKPWGRQCLEPLGKTIEIKSFMITIFLFVYTFAKAKSGYYRLHK